MLQSVYQIIQNLGTKMAHISLKLLGALYISNVSSTELLITYVYVTTQHTMIQTQLLNIKLLHKVDEVTSLIG